MSKVSKVISSLLFLSSPALFGVNVTDQTSLDNALAPANLTPIDFTVASISIASSPGLKPVNAKDGFTPDNTGIVINGQVGGSTLDGGGNFRGLFIYGTPVTINDITFQNTAYKAGNGGGATKAPTQGGGGGGGGALGGALYVDTGNTVTITNCHFVNSSATGGIGGSVGGADGTGGGGGGGAFGRGGRSEDVGGAGGGGSLYYNGGTGVNPAGGGGGGVTTIGSDGTAADGGQGGKDLIGNGGGAGGTLAAPNGVAGTAGQGGGGGATDAGGNGGLGGAGGDGAGGGGSGHEGVTTAKTGGNGGSFGGGGGGASDGGGGGIGGFSGGGGGGGYSSVGGTGKGGDGGFGAGGGGGGAVVSGINPNTGGIGGTFGGSGGTGSTSGVGLGGGGAGLGGAIFLNRNSILNVMGTTSFTNCSAVGGAAGGTGAGDGQGWGQEIFMMSSSQINFDISADVDIPHGIQGDMGAGGGSTLTGGLTKTGTGRLTLNSSQGVGLTNGNNYTGTTTVNGGELRIFGVLNTPIVVNSGGTLSGSFNTQPGQGLTVNNGGIVSPGLGTSDVGAIFISGDYHQLSGGILQTDITFNNQVNDQLQVLGNVTLDSGAILEVYCGPGNYVAGSTYTVLDQLGTFSGTVTLVKTGPAANDVNLSVAYGSIILTVDNTVISNFQTVASGNPTSVNNAIVNAAIQPNSDLAYVVQVLGTLSSPALNKALMDISPVDYGALEWINERNNNTVADLLAEHLFKLSCGPACSKNSGWIDVFGSFMDNKKPFKKYELGRFDSNAGGVVAGWDHCFGTAWHAGLGAGYTRSSLHWKEHGGHGFMNSYYGAFYSSWHNRHLAIDSSLIAGGTDHHLNRKIGFGSSIASIHRTARSQFWGQFVTARLGLKGHFKPSNWAYEPFALADYDYFRRNTIKEEGADSLNLVTEHKTQNFMRGEAGLKIYREFTAELGCYAPYISLSWVGDFPLSKSYQEAHFKGQSPNMKVLSYNASEQMGSPEVGIKYTRGSGFSLSAGYKGYYNSRVSISNVEGRMEWEF